MTGGYSSEFYVHDGANVLLDFTDADGPGGTATPEISHRYLHGPLVDQVLAQENVSGGSVTGVLWMLADFNGAIRLNPKDAVAYYRCGHLWGKTGDADKDIADMSVRSKLFLQVGG